MNKLTTVLKVHLNVWHIIPHVFFDTQFGVNKYLTIEILCFDLIIGWKK